MNSEEPPSLDAAAEQRRRAAVIFPPNIGRLVQDHIDRVDQYN